ncbi:MAG: AraC family transcriptional regulator ligand-binding domain-containing protein [Dinoroseobacter sp.]|nr:AraC family transcriptional regulator ligand-binding domain-containing protein [Dinoroseobacter sp.]
MVETVPLITASALVGMPEFVAGELGARALRRSFSDAGLPADMPVQEGYFVPEVAAARFLGSAARQAGDPLLGAKLGAHLNIATNGAWGRHIVEGETLGGCLQRFIRTLCCFCNYDLLRIDLIGDIAWCRFRFATTDHADYPQICLATVGSCTNLVRHFTGPEWFPDAVEMDIPPPVTPSLLEDILPTEIRYNAECIALAFPQEYLTLRRRPELSQSHTTFSEAMRARDHKPPESFEAVVEEIIRLQIGSGSVSLDAAARSLDLGVRTLQRKLERTGCHFKDLTGRIRMGIAREHVAETSLPLAAVAELAGFSDQFNFSRAFRRYFGMPPSEMRKLASAHGG